MKILVTGAAGFIGFHLARELLNEGYEVVGLDNINDYYSVELKLDRLAELAIPRDKIEYGKLTPSNKDNNFAFLKAGLEDKGNINQLFEDQNFDVVINLAAQAGVRYSIKHPDKYISANINGFFNVLEAARQNPVEHFIFASSSSVYGANKKVPFSVKDNVDHPMSLYAATKKSNELIAHSYSSLYDIPTTGLRFFTVYGPWGRPDMAYFLFADAMLQGEPIKVFNHGEMERDFTYVGDIVESIKRLIPNIPQSDESWQGENPDPATSYAPYRLFNIGNSKTVNLMDFIEEIEKQLGIKAKKNMLPMQPGDVAQTWADVEDLIQHIDYRPQVDIKEGIAEFIDWYTEYYDVEGDY